MKTECLKKILFVIFATVLSVGFIACQNQIEDVQPIESNQPEVGLFSRSTSELPFLQGDIGTPLPSRSRPFVYQ